MIYFFRRFTLFATLTLIWPSYGQQKANYHKDKGIVSKNVDSFLDPTEDYSKFYGRVTDRDRGHNIIKVRSENNNIKFFKAGDEASFEVANHPGRACLGHVRDVEPFYVTFFVKDLGNCWEGKGIFRRGMQLNGRSKVLLERTLYAGRYRAVLLKQRKDFLEQLNKINNFIWNFSEKKILLAGYYDKKILSLKDKKIQALDDLLMKKKESLVLQKEIRRKLDWIDEGLQFYRIERQENLTDRWNTDQGLGLPMAKRPQGVLKSITGERRWYNAEFK